MKKCIIDANVTKIFYTYFEIPINTAIRTYMLIKFQDQFSSSLLFGLHAYSASQSLVASKLDEVQLTFSENAAKF